MAKEELFNEVRKLLDLKRTKFIVDPDIGDSTCRYSPEDEITVCYLKEVEDALHEGIHAYFKERDIRLSLQLGSTKYYSKIENIETDAYLEEVTTRLIEVNSQNIILNTCPDDIQKSVKFDSENIRWHENIELGKKIIRLYVSIYENKCVCPKDLKFYNDIKNDIDPIIVYNKLAKYVGTHELI